MVIYSSDLNLTILVTAIFQVVQKVMWGIKVVKAKKKNCASTSKCYYNHIYLVGWCALENTCCLPVNSWQGAVKYLCQLLSCNTQQPQRMRWHHSTTSHEKRRFNEPGAIIGTVTLMLWAKLASRHIKHGHLHLSWLESIVLPFNKLNVLLMLIQLPS